MRVDERLHILREEILYHSRGLGAIQPALMGFVITHVVQPALLHILGSPSTYRRSESRHFFDPDFFCTVQDWHPLLDILTYEMHPGSRVLSSEEAKHSVPSLKGD